MDNIVKASIEQAKSIMEEVPDSFHGGLEHAKKVNEIAKEILKFEKIANRDVVIVATWWHDTGRLYGNEGHEKRSAKLAYSDLIKRGIDEKFARKVYSAISHHRFDMKPITLEGDILRDADKLALFDIKRWEIAINDKTYHKFEHTIHVLPKIKNEILTLPISLKIYDLLVKDFIKYIKSVDDKDFKNKKVEILKLELDRDKTLLKI